MHGHFCPKCGQALLYGKCEKVAEGGVAHALCPRCKVPAQRSGGTFILLGTATSLVGNVVIALDTVGLVVGGGFIVVGLVRLGRQFCAFRTVSKVEKNHDSPDCL